MLCKGHFDPLVLVPVRYVLTVVMSVPIFSMAKDMITFSVTSCTGCQCLRIITKIIWQLERISINVYKHMEMVSKNYESLLDRKRKRETLHLGSHSNILFPPSTMRTLFIDRFLIVQVGVSP